MFDAPRKTRQQPLVEVREVAVERFCEHRLVTDKQFVRALTMKRKTLLGTVCLLVAQWAFVDPCVIIPLSVFCYTFGIMLATDPELVENIVFGVDTEYEEKLALNRHIAIAEFEYHILREMTNTRIFAKRETHGYVVYAIGGGLRGPEKTCYTSK